MFFFKAKKKTVRQKATEPLADVTQGQKAIIDEFDRGFAKGFPYYEKGEEYRKAKEYSKALEQYDAARSNGYVAPALYRGYVRVYKQLKEYDKAIACINEAIAQDKKYHFNSSAFADLVSEKQKMLEKMSKR